ncbi:hypothetical protein AAFF_G00428780 [Aldrovandia affinis]|uniref:Uncharacterized protein n=1 Tax=Aldrovandia affinis TaxID=143900 RepID=A0AAD7WIQ6_9TELE|nr:hypothetical protein AAFF_G00428780 [Aldrovandia affinis]
MRAAIGGVKPTPAPRRKQTWPWLYRDYLTEKRESLAPTGTRRAAFDREARRVGSETTSRVSGALMPFCPRPSARPSPAPAPAPPPLGPLWFSSDHRFNRLYSIERTTDN